MKKIFVKLLFVCMLSAAGTLAAETSDLVILGWVEKVYLVDPGIEIEAKLDTGAETSSLDARVIKKFRKGGKRWVRFAVTDRDSGEEFILVRKRVRTIGVVQHDGSTQIRPVVLLEVCIGGEVMKTEVSLISRHEFDYPLLLGRSALASFALVDPGSDFLSEPNCGSQDQGKPGL